MDNLLIAVFGLSPAIAWGISDFFYAKGSQKFGSLAAALAVNSSGALVYILAFLLFLHTGATFTAEGVLYALFGSILFGLAQTMFSRSLEIGPVSLASPISSTYPLIALIVGVLFFGTHVALLQVAGIAMIVLGVMLASGILQLKKSERRLGAGPLFALAAASGWGCGLGLISHAMGSMAWQGVFLIELLVAPIILLIVIASTPKKSRPPAHSIGQAFHSPIIWSTGAVQMLGLMCLNLGLAHFKNDGVIIVAISSCYPALTIFLALKHMKEKVPLVPLLGGIIGVLGVVVLSLGGA